MNADAIVPAHIRASGAVYVAAMLEAARVFDVVDRLVEMSQAGQLAVSRAGAGRRLYEYWQGASERLTAAERKQTYRRTLGVSGGDDSSNTVEANRAFDDLWVRFVSAVSRAGRSASPAPGDAPGVDHQQVRSSARALAANASSYGGGAVGAAKALRQQLSVIVDLLSDPEIQSAYGVQGVWQLVERVAVSDLGSARSTRRYRAMAESGEIILAWLAERSAPYWSSTGDALDMSVVSGRQTSLAPRTKPSDYDLVAACERWLSVAATDHE
jgi:hypothetical protein